MRPEDRQAIETLLKDVETRRDAAESLMNSEFSSAEESWAAFEYCARRLALLLVEVHQLPRDAENINENADTRGVDDGKIGGAR